MARPKNCKRCGRTLPNCVCGRPTVINDEVLRKLDEAFAIGCSDIEAVVYAGISARTLYTFQKDNEDFLQRKRELKEKPVLLARKTVVESIKTNPSLAFTYLERKKKKEFAQRQENKQIGPIKIQNALEDKTLDELLKIANEKQK